MDFRLCKTQTLLILLFLCSCSGSVNVSKNLPEAPPSRFERKYNPDLPYEDIVKTVHATRNSRAENYGVIQEFDEYTYLINSTILDAVFDIRNVPYKNRAKARNEFKVEYAKLSREIYTDFRQEYQKVEYLPQNNLLINYNVSLSIDAFSNVLASRICTVAGIALSVSGVGAVYTVSSTLLCETLLSNLLMPILEELKNRALIMDYVDAEIRITEHIRELIFELATVQDRFKADFISKPKKRILFKNWISKADLEIKVNATIKAGFNLKKNFQLRFSEEAKRLTIYLPRAEILSEDFNYNIVKMKDGWFISVDKEHINAGMAEVKRRLRNEALQSGILIRAESHAELVVSSLLEPLLENKRFDFDTRVVFVD